MKQLLRQIAENKAIDLWAGRFRHSPGQINRTHETDSELYVHPSFPGSYLAITIDTVAEEISTRLYRDPFTMGWVCVAASLSDLAAVGAQPLGLVISTMVEGSRDSAWIGRIAHGMEQAARTHDTFILGGDTNTGLCTALTSCAIGLTPSNKALTRCGMRPGDILFATGPIGSGNALGLIRLADLPEELYPETCYRPHARLDQGRLLRGFASTAMDTSDGLLATLDQLMRINGHGFLLDAGWDAMIEPRALQACRKTSTPPWMMLGGPHGEFELVFSISPGKLGAFLKKAKAHRFRPVRLGTVQKKRTLTFAHNGTRRIDVDFSPLRNIIHACGAHPERLIKEFESFGQNQGLHGYA